MTALRRIVLGATVFLLLFGSLTFGLAWRKMLMPAADDRPAPATSDVAACKDECPFGARWKDVSLWPNGAPSLDTYPELLAAIEAQLT